MIGWAIEGKVRGKKEPFLCGVYYFTHLNMGVIQRDLEQRPLIFRTRQRARDAAHKVSCWYMCFKPVKVKVITTKLLN